MFNLINFGVIIIPVIKKGEKIMYHVYIIDETAFDPKKSIGDFSDIENARARLQREFAKNEDVKYVIEQTTGHVDSYGELIATVVEEN